MLEGHLRSVKGFLAVSDMMVSVEIERLVD
jgi:hypothetical protein